MCFCDTTTCPKCDPGIEEFYQKKVKAAKEAVAYLKTTGVEMHYEDLLDAKDIWYEYCALRDEERIDDAIDKDPVPEEAYNLKDSW